MANKTIREFARKYDGLQLLSHSNASIILGDLYKKKGFFRQRFDFSGYNIAYLAYGDSKKSAELKKRLGSIRAFRGEFAGIRIKDRFSNQQDMQLPFIGLDLSDKLDVDKLISFEIGKINQKILRDADLIAVKKALRFYTNHNEDRHMEAGDFWMVRALFYGDDIRITLDKSVALDLKADFSKTVTTPALHTDKQHNQVFTFSGCSAFPFAMDLVRASAL